MKEEEVEEEEMKEIKEVEDMNMEGKEEEMEVEANFRNSDDSEKEEGVSEYDLKEEVKVDHDPKVVLGMSIGNAKEILDTAHQDDSLSEYGGSMVLTSTTSGVASKDIRTVQQNTPPHTNKMVTSGLATADPDALQRSSLTTTLEDTVANTIELNSLSLSTITPEMAEFVCSNLIKVAAVMTFYLKSRNRNFRNFDIFQNVFLSKRRRPR